MGLGLGLGWGWVGLGWVGLGWVGLGMWVGESAKQLTNNLFHLNKHLTYTDRDITNPKSSTHKRQSPPNTQSPSPGGHPRKLNLPLGLEHTTYQVPVKGNHFQRNVISCQESLAGDYDHLSSWCPPATLDRESTDAELALATHKSKAQKKHYPTSGSHTADEIRLPSDLEWCTTISQDQDTTNCPKDLGERVADTFIGAVHSQECPAGKNSEVLLAGRVGKKKKGANVKIRKMYKTKTGFGPRIL